jgi:hypothetical protein
MKNYPSHYLFLITPLGELEEQAFEQSLVQSLNRTYPSFSHRSVKGTSQTLFRGKDEEGRTRYLWRLDLELVSGPNVPLGSGLASLLSSMREQLRTNGTIAFVAAVEEEINIPAPSQE